MTDNLNSSFPLYNLLVEKTKNNPFSASDCIELVENVRKLDKSGFDLLFVIIRIYSLKNSVNETSEIPYGGQKVDGTQLESKTDVKFDIRNFPDKLNHMLLEFTKMHLSKDN